MAPRATAPPILPYLPLPRIVKSCVNVNFPREEGVGSSCSKKHKSELSLAAFAGEN